MAKIAWATDLHLNFLSDREVRKVVGSWNKLNFDFLLISGDIAQGNNIEKYLLIISEVITKPVCFVLGNHDFYHSSFNSVYARVDKWRKNHPNMYRLGKGEIIPLAKRTALIGHGGWADGRLGNYEKSRVMLNDYILINDFIKLGKEPRLQFLNKLGDESAAYFKNILPRALEKFERVVLLTHVPPFREASTYRGQISNDDYLPHFSCKAVGDILTEVMKKYPAGELIVLCGHTHGRADVKIGDNIRVRAGKSKYGNPVIQDIFEAL